MKIVIDGNAKTHPFRKHWQFCVGSGHAPLALRADYAVMLKKVHEELGIRYVRFHGIFNDDMDVVRSLADILPAKGAEVFTEYNFEKIGAAYANVLSCGMKPFVELSFMPRLLGSADTVSGLFYGGNITPPADEKKWRHFIQAFVRYLLRRFGEKEVESWYFEVWNEPDLGVFFDGKKADYFRLYEVTARAIKDVDEKLRVGGPATSASKWIGSFLDYCQEHNVPLDFVSTHQYAGDPICGVAGGADPEAENEKMNLDFLKQRNVFTQTDGEKAENDRDKSGDTEEMPPTILEGFRQIMKDQSELADLPGDSFRKNAAMAADRIAQYGSLPLIYTEWNANAIFSAETNDTRKVAAYDLKAALDTELTVDASGIWCFCDLFEEFHHFQEEFHGGFGMLTSHGIEKPVYHALRMLSEAGEERIELEDGATDQEIGRAAFRDQKAIQILLFRQKMKNSRQPEQKAEVEVILSQKPARVTVRKIDETHGNPLAVWEKLGRPVPAMPDQIERIRKEADTFDEPLPFVWKNGKLCFDAKLGVNDIWMVSVETAQEMAGGC